MSKETTMIWEIMNIARSCIVYRKQQLSSLDLPPARHVLIGFICQHPGCQQDTIVTRLCMDKTTVAHHLSDLEQAGYIRREASEEDARCRLIYPTDKALEAFPAIHDAFHSFAETIMGELDEEEKASLQAMLEKLNARATGLAKEINERK